MDEYKQEHRNSTLENATNWLFAAIVDIETQASAAKAKEGVKQNIESLRYMLSRILRQMSQKSDKTIGFFGGQKRGKSSLINELLKCDLMPVKAIPLSSIVVRVMKDTHIPDGMFDVEIKMANGFVVPTQEVDLTSAQFLQTTFGTRQGPISKDVAEITVRSKFSESKILAEGGILVDTPGAEYAFGTEDPDHILQKDRAVTDNPEHALEMDDSEAEKFSEQIDAIKQNLKETERALSILNQTQIIIFCERKDYLENKNSKEFYDDHLRVRNPLNVLNFMDKADEDTEDSKDLVLRDQIIREKMRNEMVAKFAANMNQICCVSCKYAKDARKNRGAAKTDEDASGFDKIDEELYTRSNIPELECYILRELEKLSPQKGLLYCLNQQEKIIQQLSQEQCTISINRLFMHNFISELKKENGFEETIQKAGSFL